MAVVSEATNRGVPRHQMQQMAFAFAELLLQMLPQGLVPKPLHAKARFLHSPVEHMMGDHYVVVPLLATERPKINLGLEVRPTRLVNHFNWITEQHTCLAGCVSDVQSLNEEVMARFP
jgi:hypothetical protein